MKRLHKNAIFRGNEVRKRGTAVDHDAPHSTVKRPPWCQRIPFLQILKRPLGSHKNAGGEDAEVAMRGGEGRPAHWLQQRGAVHSAQSHEAAALDEAKPEHLMQCVFSIHRLEGVDPLLETPDE